MKTHEERLPTALEILEGLSVGDALGEALSYQHHRARELSDFSVFSDGSVRYTDDTEMARRILESLSTGSHWKDVSMIAFGSGSFGNGAAMRVAPIGG